VNRLRLLTGVGATLASSLALVLTMAPAHARQTASQACYGASARVEQTTVVTVPRVAGFRFSVNGAAYQTGSDGAVQLVGPPCISTYRLHVLTPIMPLGRGRRARFARWSGEFNGESLLYARFDTYRLVRLSFQEGSGRPIDRRLLGVVTLKSDVGQIVHLPTDVDRWWLQSSRVVAGLNIRPIYWTVQSVPADGSNVVTASKIKFFPGRTSSVRITLLYFRLTIRVKDRLFGWPVGSSVELRFPSGHRALYHLGPDGHLSLPSEPRGIYALRVNGSVVKVWRPVALSRDQDVALDTLSYLDVAVLAGVGLLIIIGPLAAGRLLRNPRTSRRRRIHQVATTETQEAEEAEEISSVSTALREARPQDTALQNDMLQEDTLQGDTLPDDAVQDHALPDIALPDDAVRTDFVQADALQEEARQDVALPDLALPDVAVPDLALPDEEVRTNAVQADALPAEAPLDDALTDVATLTDDSLLNGAVGTDAVHEVLQDDAVQEDTVGTNAVGNDAVTGDTVRYDMVTDGAVQEYRDETVADDALQEDTVMRDAVTDQPLQRGGPQPDAVQMPLWDEPQEDALHKARREDALQNAQQEDALQTAMRDDALRQDPLQLALRDDAPREDPLQLALPEDPVKLALQEDALQMALRDDPLQDDMLHEDTPREDALQGDARDEDTLQVQLQEDELQEDGLQVALQVAALQAAALAEDASS